MTDRRRFLGGAAGAALAGMVLPAAGLPALEERHAMPYRKAVRHNGWIEVDAAAFEANLAELARVVGPTPVCAVLKADAYGHGLDLLMPSVLRQGVRLLGITSNEEAAVARARGYRGRLMRLRSATGDEIEDGVALRVEEMAGNADLAREIDRVAARRGRRIAVHLMLNSAGMSRNGVELKTDEGRAATRDMTGLRNLRWVGVMSHFPVEEAADVRDSLAQFQGDCEWVFAQTPIRRQDVMLHVANTFATLNVPESRLDLVRCGGTLYDDLYGSNFQQVMSLKSRVACVNAYPKGNTVSYDRTFRLERDSLLANIPLGYSDGYRRIFSRGNRPADPVHEAFALVGGHRVPVVGRVTMNTVMLDVTDVHADVRMGDEVVFLGRQGAERIGWAEWERWSGTITEDLGTVMGNSMPRVLAPRPGGSGGPARG